jgi:hypothetical protein
MPRKEDALLVVTQLQKVAIVVKNDDGGCRVAWPQSRAVGKVLVDDGQSSFSRIFSTVRP